MNRTSIFDDSVPLAIDSEQRMAEHVAAARAFVARKVADPRQRDEVTAMLGLDGGYMTLAAAIFALALGAIAWTLVFAFISETATVAAGIAACALMLAAGVCRVLGEERAA